MKFKTIITGFLLFGVLILCNSCVRPASLNQGDLPRESFIHLNKSFKIYQCGGNTCARAEIANLRSGASGFIIRVTSKGSYIITAAHFCEDKTPTMKNVRIVSSLVSTRLDGKEYKSEILEYQRDIDVCLVFAEGLTSGVHAVRLSNVAPVPGDKVFNLAAPFSIVAPNVVPIMEGRYNGQSDSNDFYTLPAGPGSSGSMIINEDNELIGMVHSVFVRFNVIALSTTFENLMNFININLRKHSKDSANISVILSLNLGNLINF